MFTGAQQTNGGNQSTGKRRSLQQGDEGSFAYARIMRALYPVKTAEAIAAKTGCSVRQAQFRLAGKYAVTTADIRVILNELLDG